MDEKRYEVMLRGHVINPPVTTINVAQTVLAINITSELFHTLVNY